MNTVTIFAYSDDQKRCLVIRSAFAEVFRDRLEFRPLSKADGVMQLDYIPETDQWGYKGEKYDFLKVYPGNASIKIDGFRCRHKVM